MVLLYEMQMLMKVRLLNKWVIKILQPRKDSTIVATRVITQNLNRLAKLYRVNYSHELTRQSNNEKCKNIEFMGFVRCITEKIQQFDSLIPCSLGA